MGRVSTSAGGPGPTQDDYERLALLRHHLRRFMAFSSAAAHDAGLSVSQHQALLSVRGHPGPGRMTIGQLAAHLVIAPHTAAELVARLETEGLVTKLREPADRRCIRLALTPRAEKVLHHLSSTHLLEIRELAPGLIAALDALVSSGRGCESLTGKA